MNSTVNLSQLITRLSEITESDPNTARRFLHDFFALIETELVAGNEVDIKGIGTFRRLDGSTAADSTPSVGFIPAESLAEAINAPFAMFEPVELAEGVDEAALAACDTEQPTLTEEADTESPSPDETSASAEISQEEIQPQDETETDPEEIMAEDNTTEEVAVCTVEATENEVLQDTEQIPGNNYIAESDDNFDSIGEQAVHRRRPRRGLWALAGLIFGLSAGYGISWLTAPMPAPDYDYVFEEEVEITAENDAEEASYAETGVDETSENNTITPEAVETGKAATSIQEAPAENETENTIEVEPSNVVYDTVTKNRFLATMSRAHYGGVMEYWVYIYEANRDKLGNPDRIEPGTRVVIPPMSSFAPEGDTPRARAEAIRLASEIYARFR